MSASAVNNPIFETKATEYKTKIFTTMLSRSRKTVLSFGYMAASASPKISDGGFTTYSRTSGSGVLKFESSKGGIEFEKFPKSKTENVSGE